MALTNEQKRQNKISRTFKRFDRLPAVGACTDEVATKFQKLVRLENANENGDVQCVTCGVVLDWRMANGGHFHDRRHLGTLLDRRNVHCQCVHCNLHLAGNSAEYLLFMQDTYCQEILDELVRLKRSDKTFTRIELAELYVDFCYEIRNLEKRIGGAF